jgi:hypothetical protein
MIAVLEILALRWAAGDRIGFKHLLVTGAGLAAGYGLVRWFLAVNQIEIVSRVDFMMFKGFMEWVKMNALNLPMSVASLFNVHWLILVICLVMFFKRNRFFYALVLVFLLLNSAFTVFTLDTTRIFALLSWGVLFECLFHSYNLANAEKDSNPQVERQFLQSLIAVSIVSLFAPRYFSWLGEIHTTPFYQFLRKVFR